MCNSRGISVHVFLVTSYKQLRWPPTQVTTTIEADGRGEGEMMLLLLLLLFPTKKKGYLEKLVLSVILKYQHISNLRVWWSESLITWLTRSVSAQDGESSWWNCPAYLKYIAYVWDYMICVSVHICICTYIYIWINYYACLYLNCHPISTPATPHLPGTLLILEGFCGSAQIKERQLYCQIGTRDIPEPCPR